jgi:hypothetical protein
MGEELWFFWIVSFCAASPVKDSRLKVLNRSILSLTGGAQRLIEKTKKTAVVSLRFPATYSCSFFYK